MPKSMRALGPILATLVFAALIVLLAALFVAASQIAGAMPSAVARARTVVESGGVRLFGLEVLNPAQLRSLAAQLIESTVPIARGVLAALANATAGIVLMLFLVLLLLLERRAWRRKIETVAGPQSRLSALAKARIHLRRFLLTRLLLGVVTGLLYVSWLYLFGIDLLLAWGMLALLLNFIPNIGSIIADVLPAVYAAATRDIATALAVAAGLLVIEQVIGNYVDPRLMGKQLALSPFIVLVSQTQRQAEHDRFPDTFDYGIGQRLGIGEPRRRTCHPMAFQPASG